MSTSSAPVVVGVIGVGRIGRMHIDNILARLPAVRIAWVCDLLVDTDAEMRAWLDARALGARRTADYREILGDAAVEAVLVLCSTGAHLRISLDALAARKHVFCEKPVSESPAEIREVMHAVEKSGGLKYQVGFNRRFDRNFARVREAVARGELGEPQILRVTSRDPTYVMSYLLRSATEGGMMADMTIHDFDMLNYVIGEHRARCTEVYALGACLIEPAVKKAGDVDTAIVTLRFADGALASIDNSRKAVYGYDQRVEVFGTAGCVVAENEAATTCRFLSEGAAGSRREQREAIPWWFTERYQDAFVAELAGFARCVRAGPDVRPLVTCADQLRATLLANAARESLRTGRPVAPEPF
eukprot:m51a1_g5305 hypothetical protein (358) ;mRNA; f:265676-267370